MEPISTFITIALGYILNGATQSKTAENAKNEMLDAFWHWVRPLFLKDVPELEEVPEDAKTEEKTEAHLLSLIEDETFFKELAQKVAVLQKAGVKEKNIVRGDITRVKKIRIGDKEYHPDDTLKNIIEGNVSDSDEFILGDGH